MKKSSLFLFLIWTIHVLAFVFQWNFFPILNYDLFSRPQNFNNSAEYFLAKTSSVGSYDVDISKEISFNSYWKFIVTVRRILREDPNRLSQTIKRRIHEINETRTDKIESVQFVEISRTGDKKVLFEVSIQ